MCQQRRSVWSREPFEGQRMCKGLDIKEPCTTRGNTGLFYNKAWQCPTFTWGDPTLSSALSVLTSEFGMDSGGSHSLLSPGNSFTEPRHF